MFPYSTAPPPKYLLLTLARMECVPGALSPEVKWEAGETHNSPPYCAVDKNMWRYPSALSVIG
jgi:hypothetical protein